MLKFGLNSPFFDDGHSSFLDLLIAGEVSGDDIDDFVSHWHAFPGDKTLREYLGFTIGEYQLWLSSPDDLALIATGRRSVSTKLRV